MIVICLIRTMVSQEQTYGAGANSGKLKVILWFLSGQNQEWFGHLVHETQKSAVLEQRCEICSKLTIKTPKQYPRESS